MSNRELNFEFLCRVCAAQTKGRNSVAECVYILKTPELKEKIQRFLNLTVSAEDSYPKVLCKTCFRQVEATASLAKIAQHTQTVFRNFVFNHFTNPDVFTPLDMICKEIEKPTMLPPPPVPPLVPYREELVVNVSVSDPLTRETQEKMISASQKRQSLSDAHKRQSLTDARHVPKSIAQRSLSVPKSMNDVGNSTSSLNRKSSPAGVINFFHGNQPQVTPYSSSGYAVGNATNTTTPSTVAGTGNSFNAEAKRKNLQKTLNKIKATNSGQVSLLKVSQKSSSSSGLDASKLSSSPPSREISDPPPLPHSLSIIKPAAVSIPAPVHRSNEEPQKVARKSSKTNPIALTRDVDVLQADELPAQIIIASTKNRKNSNHSLKDREKGGVEGTVGIATAIPRPDVADEILLGRVIKDVDLLKLILKALKWPVTMQTMERQMARLKSSKFSEIMSDQNLLQDTDLTQLLSPYLAPILYAAQALQQNVSTSSAPASAPSTSTQSYMPPFKPIDLQAAAITSAIPYKLPAETSVQLVPASPEREDPSPPHSVSNTSGPSIQMTLLDSTSGKEPPAKRPKKTAKQRTAETASIFPIDVEDIRLSLSKSESSLPKPKNVLKKCSSHYNLPTVNAYQATKNAQITKLNDELRLLLDRQNMTAKSMRRKRTNSAIQPPSQSTNDSDLDDIILLENEKPTEKNDSNSNEQPSTSKAAAQSRAQTQTQATSPPQPSTQPVPNSNAADDAAPSTSNPSVVVSSVKSSESSEASKKSETDFQVPMPPMVARPIIKRRKTVIQTSSRSSLSNSTPSDSNLTIADSQLSAELFVVNKTLPPLQRRSSLSVADFAGFPTPTVIQSQEPKPEVQAPTVQPTPAKGEDAAPTSTEMPTSTKTSEEPQAPTPVPSKGSVKRVSSSKSSLGQQLLEAIGLQKITSNSNGNSLSNSALAGRDSVQAVRSALKLSLKQAQQRKQVETVKQVADSTTKTNIKDGEEIEQNNERSEGGETRVDSMNVESVSQKKVIDKNEEKEDSKSIDKEDENVKKVNESRRKILNIKKANLPPHTDSENSPLDKPNQSKSSDKKVVIIEESPKDSEEIKTALSGAAIMPPKKRGRKSNEVKEAERKERELREAEAKNKINEEDESVNNTSPSGRPTRHSKTMSKYYKPEKQSITRRSVSTRSTRSRN